MKIESELIEKSWWNRPLFSSVSLWERVLGALTRKNIPELALSLYDQEFKELEKIEPTLRMLDNGQYSSEFLFYVNIKQKMGSDLNEYQHLATFIEICDLTTRNIKHLHILSRVELDFGGKTQVRLYKFVEEQLNSDCERKAIRKSIQNEIKRLIFDTRNEPTKEALISYNQALQSILKQKLGLKLLKFLKKHKITNYSIYCFILSL